MEQAVMRDPESSEATLSVEQTVRHLDRFLASQEMRTIIRLPRKRRPALPPEFADKVQALFNSLQSTLSVAIQIDQLGGRVDWVVPLENALDRLQRVFAKLGVPVDRSWKPGPPIVSRLGIDVDGRPRLSISTKSFRQPRLEPYIAVALREAQPIEIEPGHWYADLERFPGVWADGVTPAECLEALADVLHEWLIVKVVLGDQDVPVLDSLDPRALILPISNP
jgi:predicted RNase H-like HicB family nuclease